MQWKEFFKPTTIKVILTIILSIPILFINAGGYWNITVGEFIILPFIYFSGPNSVGWWDGLIMFLYGITFLLIPAFVIYLIISTIFYFSTKK